MNEYFGTINNPESSAPIFANTEQAREAMDTIFVDFPRLLSEENAPFYAWEAFVRYTFAALFMDNFQGEYIKAHTKTKEKLGEDSDAMALCAIEFAIWGATNPSNPLSTRAFEFWSLITYNAETGGSFQRIPNDKLRAYLDTFATGRDTNALIPYVKAGIYDVKAIEDMIAEGVDVQLAGAL